MLRLGLLLGLLAAASSDHEERLRSALQADFAEGKATRVAALVADEIQNVLSEERLGKIHGRMRERHGKVLSCKRLEATPFRHNRPVLFRVDHERGANLLTLVVNDEGRITGYWIKPAPPSWSLEETRRRIEAWSGEYGYERVILDPDGTVLTRDSLARGREHLPLGSIFKLYILAELAAQLEAGKVKLDQEVEIVERRKSLPSGILQNKPPGAKVSLREMAKGMIAISDNTATDHLLHLVGRANVEAGLKGWRNSVPDRNTPFLSTREMFLVKGGGKEREVLDLDFTQLLDQYAAAKVERRREIIGKLCEPWSKKTLAQLLPAIGFGYQLRTSSHPRHIELEWFAKPGDITALLIDAHQRRLKGAKHFLNFYATGTEIYPRAGLRYYGYKGGSEPGVFALSLLAVRPDGRTVAICLCRCGELEAEHATNTVQVVAALTRLALE
jgi:hypothetical protein